MSILCLTVMCLIVPIVRADDSSASSVTRDGLKLEVAIAVNHDTKEATAVCTLTNTTNKGIPFESTGPNSGFSFKLVDATGKEVAKNPAWEKMNVASPMSKHSAKQLEPGEALTYTLNFKEAFAAIGSSGSKLEVEWSPGDDPKGNPLPTGRGIRLTINVM